MNESSPIAVSDLTFAYRPGAEPVLEHVDWTVPTGSFTALIGPNGGGKTTLLQLVLGLLKPQRGSVQLFGSAPSATRHRVGYIPQRDAIDDTCPHTALEVVLSGRLRRSRWGFTFGSAHRRAAMAALERVGLAQRAGATLDQLSGGQRQRVRLARALAAEAELLILDEPLTGIDPGTEAGLVELLGDLHRSCTIVMVSHDVTCVSQHVTHVACCHRSVSVHRAEELAHEHLHQLYHGHHDCRPISHDPASCPFTHHTETAAARDER